MTLQSFIKDLNNIWDYVRRPPTARMGNLERLIRWSWQSRVTANGRVCLIVLCAAGTVAATIGPRSPLYVLPIFLLSFLFVAGITGVIFRPSLWISRHLPERCSCGAVLQVIAKVRNTGWLPIFDLTVTENMPPSEVKTESDPSYLDHLPKGEETSLEYTLEMTRRGAYEFSGPIASTAFPFGMYHSGRSVDSPQRILVYPRFEPLTAVDLPAGRKHQPGGLQLVSQVGDSEEFLGLREYRPGDRLRDLHHSAWARLGIPIVREYQQEYLCRIALIVDTFTAGTRHGIHPGLEASLSLGAAIADNLSRLEYVIDIFAAGPNLYHFQAGRSLGYLENILDVLACIEPCTESPFAELAPAVQEQLTQISTAVVVLLDWDEEREKFVSEIRERGVAVKVIVIHEGTPANDPSDFHANAGAVQIFTPTQINNGVGEV